MYMQIDKGLNIRIIDSLNFLPMKLASLPKAFGLTEVKKGYFPHWFNLKGNQNYVGAFPDPHMYGVDYMGAKYRDAFLSWYSQQRGQFDFSEEMKEYCISDVTVLREACLKFQQLMMEATGEETEGEITGDLPPKKTIMGHTMSSLRVVNGFHKDNFNRGVLLSMKQKQFQVLLLKYHVRGMLDMDNIVRSSTILPRTKQSVEELYALTCKKSHLLKQKGYKVIVIWEHEFHQQLKDKPDMKAFVSTLDIQDRLEPRDSFFGGRTNASTLHYKVKESEEIHYVDFTSLYPWVNKYCQYPIGHPQIIHKNFQSLDHYFGIAKVKVLPPRKLYHPVLPYRSEGKLKFPLCSTCADKEQQTACEHSDEQRTILGTWCTPEKLKAIEKGYQVIKVYEVYHWSETAQSDTETGSCGLFTDYINTFLKLKQQASGWPVWCETEDDKEKYIADYREKEGIQLDKDRIEKTQGYDPWRNYV
ncbi:uncharacterized protein [Haliotis asinina]|uniref:uncharacterized protein n=1 Tax=Haliotis asinina TaxID=109174 RepID=UPI0035318125